MKRKQVYNLIDGERDYQDSLGSDRREPTELPHSVGDYIVMLQHYQNVLVSEWTKNPGNEKALDVVRKIGGIAVHCMEDHGAPERKMTTSKLDSSPEELQKNMWSDMLTEFTKINGGLDEKIEGTMKNWIIIRK